jgi:predicted transglutaminase-like cysteine proteinase
MKGSTEHTKYVVTKERLLELDTVNRWVNQNVKPMTDRQLYKVEEYWTIPIELRGDCEDYALLKRHLLIRRGWPAGALLMTVVVDAHGENHAVLTVRTSIGDYVLDNQSDRILLWHDTAFKRWIMRQSYIDPNVWMALDLKILTTAK